MCWSLVGGFGLEIGFGEDLGGLPSIWEGFWINLDIFQDFDLLCFSYILPAIFENPYFFLKIDF